MFAISDRYHCMARLYTSMLFPFGFFEVDSFITEASCTYNKHVFQLLIVQCCNTELLFF